MNTRNARAVLALVGPIAEKLREDPYPGRPWAEGNGDTYEDGFRQGRISALRMVTDLEHQAWLRLNSPDKHR